MQRPPSSGSDKPALSLSVPRLCAGALASVSAAVIASTFGLAGTLVGAAISSIVVTAASAVYLHSIEQARTRIHYRTDYRTGEIVKEVIRRRPLRISLWNRSIWHELRWRAIGGSAVLIFLLAIGAITAIEVSAQRPLSAVMQGKSPAANDQTTIAALVHDVSGGSQTPTSPTPTAVPNAPAMEPTVTPAVPEKTATAVPTSTSTNTSTNPIPVRPLATPGK
jgi:hypothetical protein